MKHELKWDLLKASFQLELNKIQISLSGEMPTFQQGVLFPSEIKSEASESSMEQKLKKSNSEMFKIGTFCLSILTFLTLKCVTLFCLK